MKSELTEVSESRRRLSVEIGADEVDQSFERALRAHRKSVSVPGFRPGKAPMEIVKKRLAGTLGKAVAEDLLERFAQKAVIEQHVRPIEGSVTVELEEGSDEPPPAQEGEPYTFTLMADVMPKIELKEYKGLKVSRPAVEIEPQEIEEELSKIRESLAKLDPVEGRPSREGDIVEAEIEGKELGGETVASKETRMIRIGGGGTPPQFDQGLTGLNPGEEFAFEVTFPDDFRDEGLRGRVAYFRGEVKNIYVREVPELDDETVRQFGDGIETLADFRERVKSSIEERKEHEADSVLRRRLLDKLLDAHVFEAPQTLVDQELRRSLERMGQSLMAQGIDPEKLDVDWSKVVDEQRAGAIRNVREALLLDAVVDAEKIEATPEEIDAVIASVAEGSDEKVSTVRNKMKGDGSLEVLKTQVVRRKCLDWLVAAANIV